MHDIKAIRDNPEAYDRAWASKGLSGKAQEILALDARLRAAQTAAQAAQSQRNDASKLIGQAKGRKDEAEAARLMGEVESLKGVLAEQGEIERAVAEAIGKRFPLGEWSANSQLLASLVTALIVGVAISVCVNADAFHSWTRKMRISSRSGHPCEWFGIFAEYPRYVVLQLKDGVRIYGWPKVWPSEYDNGHFFITAAVRTVEDTSQELDALDGILIDVRDVSSVEFVKPPEGAA